MHRPNTSNDLPPIVLKRQIDTPWPVWVDSSSYRQTLGGTVAISGGWGLVVEPEFNRSNWGLPGWRFETAISLLCSSSWTTRLDVEAEDAVLVRRDALGISPVFVRSFDWGWAIAADLVALLALGPSPVAETRALAEYIFYDGWIGGPLPFGNLFMVPPDELWRLDLRSRTPVCEKRWTGDVLQHKKPDRLTVASFTEVTESIQEALNVFSHAGNLGLFMSGGLDSTLLAALACEVNVKLKAFTCVIDEPNYNELASASAVARHLHLEIIQVPLDRRSFLTGLVDAVAGSGLPVGFPNQVGLAVVAQKAGLLGVQLMLTGEGADELFCGYPRLIELRERLRQPAFGQKPQAIFGSDLERESLVMRGLDDLARLGFGFPERMAVLSRLRMLVTDENDPLERELLIAWMAEFLQTLPVSLLRLHVASRSGGVLVAFPYLSKRVVEASVALQPRLSILEKTKPVIRDLATKRLPPQILELPKSGFDIPLESWLPPLEKIIDNGFEEIFGVPKEHALSWARYAPASRDLRWATLNIELWSRLFVLGHSADEVKDWVTPFFYEMD